jgi:hypothetical protein
VSQILVLCSVLQFQALRAVAGGQVGGQADDKGAQSLLEGFKQHGGSVDLLLGIGEKSPFIPFAPKTLTSRSRGQDERMACAAAATPLERQEQGRLQGQIRIASSAYAGNKDERMAVQLRDGKAACCKHWRATSEVRKLQKFAKVRKSSQTATQICDPNLRDLGFSSGRRRCHLQGPAASSRVGLQRNRMVGREMALNEAEMVAFTAALRALLSPVAADKAPC